MRLACRTVVLLLVTGCAGAWRQVSPPIPQFFAPAAVVKVWVGDEHAQLYGVSIKDDSMFGTPLTGQRSCSACRRSWPLASIDSIQIRHTNPDRAAFSVGFLIGLGLMYALIWHTPF